MRTTFFSALILGAALAAAAGCSDENSSASGTAGGGTGTSTAQGGASSGTAQGGATGTAQGGSSGTAQGGSSGTAQGGAGVGGAWMGIAECQGHVYQCGDQLDNDGDGLVDAFDPDCLGPCDNTEDSYFGGIPGQNNAPCKMDCYFDQDTGPGNDDCYWDHRCDPNEVDPNYYPEPNHGSMCEYDPNFQIKNNLDCADAQAAQSATCGSYCGPLTPNGCDCFGCCELPAGSGKTVWLGSVGADGTTVCTIADLDNPDICHPCIQVAACNNPCDPCEICIGKPMPDPGCNPGTTSSSTGAGGSTSTGSTTSTGSGGGTQCPAGVQECGLPGQSPCAQGYFCVTGCCYQVPQ
jgi:hypothetical protein